MMKNFIYSVKDFNELEKKVISLWFYRICCGIDYFRNYEECQILYNSLVSALNLEDHSRKVINAFIARHKRNKFLTESIDSDTFMHPFDLRGPIDDNYREDSTIYDTCGGWSTDTLKDINLVRAVFASKSEPFTDIIASTFFCKPNEEKKNFTIPKTFKIPQEILDSSRKCDTVKFFIDSFNLSEEEGQILNLSYISHATREIYPIFNTLVNQNDETSPSLYARCLDIPVRSCRGILRNDKKLISYGIMDSEGSIAQDAADCIYAGDLNVFFCDVLKNDTKKEIYPLDSFSVSEEESELAIRLLQGSNSSNILLYGAPGAGKTEYARSLVKKSGLKPLLFKNELEVNDSDDNNSNHALSRLNCLLSLEKKDSVIIVDEAESMLSTGMISFFSLFGGNQSNAKKGTVNTMLENSNNKVIWILNYTNILDESTLRRFTYSIRFKEMSRTMLRNIVDTKLGKITMSRELHENLVDLCGKYHVTGASVDNMVKTVQGMHLDQNTEDRVVSDVQKVLEANSTLLYGKSTMREKVKDSYDLGILNTSTPAEEIVDMVKNAQEFAEKNGSEETGIRMLFYGLSGTGKTELARFIAQKLNKKIILKRTSDILGKYVGENEENIRRAFEQAEASGDVLLFDEADSFFANRDNAHTSWERTMVNEFLTQMEEFSGILICTTNLRKIMDPAMQRRFHIITEFKPLDFNGIKTLLKKFFRNYDFNEKLVSRLADYTTVTPGDFAALSGKIRFKKSDDISSELIIDELCEIQREKQGDKKVIGFEV